MLNGLAVLIVEDDLSVSEELAFCVEHLDGRPIGPVATVAEGLALLGTEKVGAAIVDANLLDGQVTLLALKLVEKSVPFVIHTGTGLPAALAVCHPDLPVVLKPATPSVVLDALIRQISADHSAGA
jgi:ActR/RegA family two-component response regulator